ncbi:MAG: hypothetical protein HWN81_07130 [Candidatus Lokiarchaeota archaeon]|nr:hypothetical protein [Candidatus Lokiarchaeota archaeon]
MSGNKITQTQNIENLVNLRELSLWANSIEKFEGLDSLKNLKVV